MKAFTLKYNFLGFNPLHYNEKQFFQSSLEKRFVSWPEKYLWEKEISNEL